DQAAIDAARKKGAERNIGDELTANSLRQKSVQPCDRFRFPVARRGRGDRPEALMSQPAFLPLQIMARRQLPHLAEKTLRREGRLERKEIAERLEIERARQARQREEGGKRRRDRQPGLRGIEE